MKKKEAARVIKDVVKTVDRCKTMIIVDGMRVDAQQLLAGAQAALTWAYFMLLDDKDEIEDEPIDVVERIAESALEIMGTNGEKGGEQ